MANVLPPAEKKRVMRETRFRFLGALALVLLLGAAVAALALAPAFISVQLAISNIPDDQPLSKGAQEDQTVHTRALALVAALAPIVSATSTPSDAAVAALSVKPSGVSITSLTYAPGKITLSGASNNRQAVNAFREALETEGRFQSVTVPVAALVGTQDGRFTMTLTGTF